MTNNANNYYCALGRFVDSFALGETAIKLALWRAAETPDHIAKAVFSGTGTVQAISFIRRISESTNTELSSLINEALSQLKAINTTRDDVLHYGSNEQADGTRIVTNAIRAHTNEKLREFPISAKLLHQMSHDLAIIVARLMTHFLGRAPEMSDPDWEETLEVANSPFLYKPPQPKKPNQ